MDYFRSENIYIIDGRVAYVTRYHKSQALFGETKVIPRFLPWRVGQLLAVYLAYVQPFSETLDQKTRGPPRSDYLWNNKNGPWHTEQLTKILTEETTLRMGLRMTTQDYRHIVICMGREYIGAEFMRDEAVGDQMPFEDSDVVVESAVDLAAAHTGAMAQRYGVLGDIIWNLSDESIRMFASIAEQWHRLLDLHHKKPQLTKHQRDLSYSTPTPSLQPKKIRAELQIPMVFMTPDTPASLRNDRNATPVPASRPASVSSRMEESPSEMSPVYTRQPLFGQPISHGHGQFRHQSGHSPSGQSGPRRFGPPSPFDSRASRQPLGPPSTSSPQFSQPSPSSSGVLSISTHPHYSAAEIQDGLVRVFNQPDAKFRSSQQEEAVMAAIELQTPLVVILPTGGGKTLTFTLGAVLRDPGVTIVVAPFKALTRSYTKRLQESQIPHVVWHHGEARYAPVVVVSADVAVSSGFITYASMLKTRKLLRRIVLDECHLTYTASDYRVRLDSLQHLHVLRCPMILLSATLPPARMGELKDAMILRDFRVVRMKTARPNIRYTVQRCQTGMIMAQVKERAEAWDLQQGQRGDHFLPDANPNRGGGTASELSQLSFPKRRSGRGHRALARTRRIRCGD